MKTEASMFQGSRKSLANNWLIEQRLPWTCTMKNRAMTRLIVKVTRQTTEMPRGKWALPELSYHIVKKNCAFNKKNIYKKIIIYEMK